MALSNRAAIVLAAGMGTRMKSATPKVLHKVAGIPILAHVLAAARGAGASRIVVVTAPAQDDVRNFAKAQGAETAIQERQLGTGDAARAAAAALADFDGVLIVTYGDHPLFLPPDQPTDAAFEAFATVLEGTGQRRGFRFGLWRRCGLALAGVLL